MFLVNVLYKLHTFETPDNILTGNLPVSNYLDFHEVFLCYTTQDNPSAFY